MRLSQQTEWIVISALIVYIAFVPSVQVVRDLLSSAVGKAVGLAVVVYAWKYVSGPVALLLFTAMWRAGGIREGADDPSMKPAGPDCHCPSGQSIDPVTKQCKKADGSPGGVSVCCGSNQMWNESSSKCEEKVTAPVSPTTPSLPTGSGAGGPPGGTTGAAAAHAALNAAPSMDTAPSGGVSANVTGSSSSSSAPV
jgi:hypothetical protein